MPRMKLVNIVPDAPGLRAMPAAALPAVRPWPMPQPSPASPTASPAPMARRPAPPPAPPPSSASATRGTRTRKRLESTIRTSLRIAVSFSLGGARRRAPRRQAPLVRVLERLPDVDHREKREHEGLQHRYEQAQAHEDRRHRDRQEPDPDAHDGVICEHVRKESHREGQDAGEVEDQLERQEERRQRTDVDVAAEEVHLEERRPQELVHVPEAVLADADRVVGDERDDGPRGGHVDVARRAADARDEPHQVRDQDEDEDGADQREVAAPLLAHRVARQAGERLDDHLQHVPERDPLVREDAAPRAGEPPAHHYPSREQQERREYGRLHRPRHVERVLEDVVDRPPAASSSSAGSRSRARQASQRSHSGSSAASAGASGTTGGRWRQASITAAGMMRESPITNPTGCAPTPSATPIPTASSRKRRPETARKPPAPGIPPPKKNSAERRRPRKFTDSSAAPASKLAAKPGVANASESAAAPADSARFVLSIRSSLTSGPSDRPSRRRSGAPAHRTRGRAAPGAARTPRSRARDRRELPRARSRSGCPPRTRRRPRSRLRRPPRGRPGRRARSGCRRSSPRDAGPPPRPRR